MLAPTLRTTGAESVHHSQYRFGQRGGGPALSPRDGLSWCSFPDARGRRRRISRVEGLSIGDGSSLDRLEADGAAWATIGPRISGGGKPPHRLCVGYRSLDVRAHAGAAAHRSRHTSPAASGFRRLAARRSRGTFCLRRAPGSQQRYCRGPKPLMLNLEPVGKNRLFAAETEFYARTDPAFG